MRSGFFRRVGGCVALLAGLLAAGAAEATCPVENTGVLVGMTDTAAYFPRLRGRRVAVLANQTSVARMPGARRGASADGGCCRKGPLG